MRKLGFYFTLALITGMMALVSSCKKDNQEPLDKSTDYSQDDAFAEGIFDNVSSIVDEAYDLGTSNQRSGTAYTIIIGPCATITLDTVVYPKELIIDFGPVNCLCNDGRYRRGKIIVSFTGRYRHPGTVITTTFDEYHVNDNKVDGSKVVTNMGPDENGHPYFTISVNGVIHRALGGTLSWNAQKVRTWIEGFDTWALLDDVYLITGEASGIRPNGKTWEREIINPLRIELGCKWIVSGTVEVRPEDRPVRVLDFGDGECDNIATVLINGVTYTIFLP